jgi:RNA ligase (TIGR02306 family)
MSDFCVNKRKVREVKHHPYADRLDICKIEDTEYQFINIRDDLKIGDYIVYFPEDSIIPDEILDLINLKGRLSGKGKNRCKAIRLRGECSQGLIIPSKRIEEYLGREIIEGEDLTKSLGVIKYEPPVTLTSIGNLHPLPKGVITYDIENVENYGRAIDFLIRDNIEVVITEKIEGTNVSIHYSKEDEKVIISTHHHAIEEIENTEKENFYCSAVRKLSLDKKVLDLAREFSADKVTIYGELIGPSIQKNIYKLQDMTIKCFDILVDDSFVNFNVKIETFRNLNIDMVPILFRGTLSDFIRQNDNKSLVEICRGKSSLCDETYREGIVITPVYELEMPPLCKKTGRLILKQKDPIYLSEF